MSEPENTNVWLKLFQRFKPSIKSPKYVSQFVYANRLLSARAKVRRLLWDSSGRRTYVKSKHGELL